MNMNSSCLTLSTSSIPHEIKQKNHHCCSIIRSFNIEHTFSHKKRAYPKSHSKYTTILLNYLIQPIKLRCFITPLAITVYTTLRITSFTTTIIPTPKLITTTAQQKPAQYEVYQLSNHHSYCPLRFYFKFTPPVHHYNSYAFYGTVSITTTLNHSQGLPLRLNPRK